MSLLKRLSRGIKPRGFAEEMLDSFPSSLQPPEPLQMYFRWLDANHLYRTSTYNNYRYALIDPTQTSSCMAIEPVDAAYSRSWTGSNDPAVFERLAAFCRTGGDGSHAALWLDDSNAIKIVHLGSGSGSTMFGVLLDDPIDFLRLLAIGYDELCWPEQHELTPEQVFDAYAREDDEFVPPESPAKLRDWVQSTFKVAVPERASDILGKVPSMDVDYSDDPFWQWDHSLPKWQS